MKATQLFKEWFHSEKTGGLLLMFTTVMAMVLANSAWGPGFDHLIHQKFGGLSLEHWVNDGLMAIFFLLIGLELERELYVGELAKPREALLPIFAALGGMAAPAAIYWWFNLGTPTQSGVGIPMATDIAFALGILSLLGNRVPTALKVFLTALAIVDDLGAILIIAIFYTKALNLYLLMAALGVFAGLLALNGLKVRVLWLYLLGGVVMWYLMLQSGVHATVSGVLLAFAIPFDRGEKTSLSYQLQHALHQPVTWVILPIFALFNTAIPIGSDALSTLNAPPNWGIAAGLVIGKPLGVVVMAGLGVGLGLTALPNRVSWPALVGTGFLAGIGFTMAIFITLLAFDDPAIIANAKLSILLSSLVAALIGLVVLRSQLTSELKED